MRSYHTISRDPGEAQSQGFTLLSTSWWFQLCSLRNSVSYFWLSFLFDSLGGIETTHHQRHFAACPQVGTIQGGCLQRSAPFVEGWIQNDGSLYRSSLALISVVYWTECFLWWLKVALTSCIDQHCLFLITVIALILPTTVLLLDSRLRLWVFMLHAGSFQDKRVKAELFHNVVLLNPVPSTSNSSLQGNPRQAVDSGFSV